MDKSVAVQVHLLPMDGSHESHRRPIRTCVEARLQPRIPMRDPAQVGVCHLNATLPVLPHNLPLAPPGGLAWVLACTCNPHTAAGTKPYIMGQDVWSVLPCWHAPAAAATAARSSPAPHAILLQTGSVPAKLPHHTPTTHRHGACAACSPQPAACRTKRCGKRGGGATVGATACVMRRPSSQPAISWPPTRAALR